MSPVVAPTLLFGVTLGIGLWSLVSMMPRLSRPRLIHRVAPYLVDVSEGARQLVERRPADPLPVLGTLLSPVLDGVRIVLGPMLGDAAVVARRLRQSGSGLGVEAFRSRQLMWAVCGAGLGIVVAVALSRAHTVTIVVQLVVVLMFAVAGFALCDFALQRSAASRVSRIAGELPIVLEFLTLSLSAGEGILDSIRRISRISGGELAVELAGVVARVNSGSPLPATLTTLADDLGLPALTRCIDQVVGALERGTPLAEVLRAQAQDAREEAKRKLIETAGKKEVAMMVPLVFLILPVTILFAIFPGIVVLQLGF